MSVLDANGCFRCDFCQSKFKDTSKLNRHIKTNKKCLSTRRDIKFSCPWCNEEFISNIYLEKHSYKCQVNKDTAYLLLLEKCKEKDRQLEDKYKHLEEKDRQLEEIKREKDRQLEEKDKMIKDLQDKLYALANTSKTTTVNNGNTYNVTLKCGKPLILSKKRFLSLLKRTCNEIYVKQGEIGLAKWFMKYACRNTEDEISIQCTDLRRGVLKFINEEGVIKQISTKYLQNFMNKCLIEYSKTDECKLIRNKIADLCADTTDFTYTQKFSEFMNPQRKFINYILEETYTKYLEEPYYEEDDIIAEEQPKSLISPFYEEKKPLDITGSGGPWVLHSISEISPHDSSSSKPQNIKITQNPEDDKFYDFSS